MSAIEFDGVPDPRAKRIEELEREVERLNRIKSRTRQAELQAENDALLADIARLREALILTHDQAIRGRIFPATASPSAWFNAVCLALTTTTPEQSLARLRNKVRDECAGVCDRFAEREMHPAECAAAIRATKEPE